MLNEIVVNLFHFFINGKKTQACGFAISLFYKNIEAQTIEQGIRNNSEFC